MLSLTDLPTFEPSKAEVFLFLLSITIFIFFFTQSKESDISQMR
ncbi:hypothetical protein J2Y02_000342 [Neobacillus drentensis]|nr:hypothetical protein [Neobacillus drentensis]